MFYTPAAFAPATTLLCDARIIECGRDAEGKRNKMFKA